MRTPKLPFLLLMVLTGILNACVSPEMDGEGVDPPPPVEKDKGTLVISPDWSNRSNGITAPSSFTVKVGDDYSANLSGTQASFPEPIIAGTYKLIVHNTASQISITNSTATVASSGGYVNATPGWLFGFSKQIEIEAQKELQEAPVMKQLMRQLTISISVLDSDVQTIDLDGTVGELTGVAGSVNIETGAIAQTSMPTKFNFTLEGNKLVANIRLVGIINGQSQNLSVNVKLKSGKTLEPYTSNMTSFLTDFNNTMTTAKGLESNITLQVSPEFSGVITNWSEMDSEDIIIRY